MNGTEKIRAGGESEPLMGCEEPKRTKPNTKYYLGFVCSGPRHHRHVVPNEEDYWLGCCERRNQCPLLYHLSPYGYESSSAKSFCSASKVSYNRTDKLDAQIILLSPSSTFSALYNTQHPFLPPYPALHLRQLKFFAAKRLAQDFSSRKKKPKKQNALTRI